MDVIRELIRDVAAGKVSATTMGGFIHVLLVLAVVVVAIQRISSRRTA